MKSILILTVGYGEGHNAAARALASGLQDVKNGEVTVEVLDLFEATYGARQELSRRIYLGMINRLPRVWAFVYWLLDRTPLLRLVILPLLFSLGRTLEKNVREKRPDAVISTYPVYAQLMDRIFPRLPFFQQYTLITDSITVNRVWINKTAHGYFVANQHTAEVLKQFGVSAEKIHALGFPVPSVFMDARHERPDPPPARILFMVNYDKNRAHLLVKKILVLPDVHLTVTVGKDEALRNQIEWISRKMNKPVEIHGWTDQMPQLLMSHHVLIGKAGGAATQEAIAAGTPFLITQIVPGQELGNARLISENHCGSVCHSHDDVIETLRRIFANNAAEWKEWERNAKALSRPDSARQLAGFIMENIRMFLPWAAMVHL